jgi:Ca2+-binding EF-hand superfamily protein
MKRYKLSEAQIIEIKDAYNHYRDPELGRVRKETLPELFRALGQVLTPKELGTALKEMDLKQGCFELIDFLCVMSRRFWDDCSRERLLQAFRGLDKEKNGLISVYELKNLLTTAGDRLTD